MNLDLAKLVFNWSVGMNTIKNRDVNEQLRSFHRRMNLFYSGYERYESFSTRFFHYCSHISNGFSEDDLNIILFLEYTEQRDELNHFYNDF